MDLFIIDKPENGFCNPPSGKILVLNAMFI